MNKSPITHLLTTDRCMLVPFAKSEVALFHQINTSPFVRKYLWDNEIITLETVNGILSENERLFNQKHFGLWKIVLEANREVAGYCGLWFFFDEELPQLLYALSEPYSGQGLATECALAVKHYAFDQLKFPYLTAATDAPHKASQRVAERIGMQIIDKRNIDGKHIIFFKKENRP